MDWPKALINEGQAILDSLDWSEPITPQREQVLSFFTLDPAQIKVVILGQDPYPTPEVANGWAFAVNSYAPIPASLANIFQEIRQVQGKVYADRTLRHWIKQGVLLLNTSLTTRIHMPNSHKHIWQSFTEKVIRWLDQSRAPIWVLWGNEAKNYRRIITSQTIVDAHPSPLSFKYRRQHTFAELIRLTDITW